MAWDGSGCSGGCNFLVGYAMTELFLRSLIADPSSLEIFVFVFFLLFCLLFSFFCLYFLPSRKNSSGRKSEREIVAFFQRLCILIISKKKIKLYVCKKLIVNINYFEDYKNGIKYFLSSFFLCKGNELIFFSLKLVQKKIKLN